ncbi:MAG: uracil-DNA glycosylase [Xanthomonadales bacterium]|nr:uracil-DNA glycosylase [Xanthomonadales bacterium]
MSEARLRMEPSWAQHVGAWFERPDMLALRQFLLNEKQAGHTIYPPSKDLFAAFDAAPFDAVKLVILGQDPYHGPNQAHGLCFSVRPGVPIPPSLNNIFAELGRDLGMPRPANGCLTPWAAQGVMLLNSVLSVEQGRAASHQGKGWEGFTDHVIDQLNRQRQHLVFMLWGAYAQTKGRLIDRERHCVLSAPHPSPLSAHRGFIGCGHFSAANDYLREHAIEPIDWHLA